MKKTTDKLINEIRRAGTIDKYLEGNGDEFIDKDIARSLNRIIDSKCLKKSDVIKKTGLNEIYAYQILSGKKAPSRNKMIAFCFGMRLDVTEAQALLKRTKYPPLYRRDPRDSIIIFCIENKKNIIQCNTLLYDHGFETVE